MYAYVTTNYTLQGEINYLIFEGIFLEKCWKSSERMGVTFSYLPYQKQYIDDIKQDLEMVINHLKELEHDYIRLQRMG